LAPVEPGAQVEQGGGQGIAAQPVQGTAPDRIEQIGRRLRIAKPDFQGLAPAPDQGQFLGLGRFRAHGLAPQRLGWRQVAGGKRHLPGRTAFGQVHADEEIQGIVEIGPVSRGDLSGLDQAGRQAGRAHRGQSR